MPSDTSSRPCSAATRRIAALLLTLSALSGAPPVAVAQDPDVAMAAVTTADPGIPLAQLELHLMPLRQDELAVEADAWLALLRGKVRQISDAQLAVQEQSQAASAGAGLAKLQTERSGLIDRLGVVLDALAAKGGESESYRLYMNAVAGRNDGTGVLDVSAIRATAVGWLSSTEGGLKWARTAASLLLVVLGFWLLSRIVGKALERALSLSERMSGLLGDFLVRMARRVVLLIGVIEAVSVLGINIGPVIAVIGATGLVVALALQSSLSNVASGILILLYRPFDIGDGVEVAGISGKVETLTLVSTQIRAWDNKTMLVPNNAVWDGVITNATGTELRRVDVHIGVADSDDVTLALEIIQSITHDHELVLKKPVTVLRMHEISDSAVTIICGAWTRSEDYWTVYWDLARLVKDHFTASGLTLLFMRRGER